MAYLPSTPISDKSTALMSHVINEVAGVLGITLKQATTKHAQTIGLLEQSHASINQALKIETGVRISLWHKYLRISVLNYNTSYHTSTGCEPSRVFHGRFRYKILDLKVGIRPQKIPSPNSEIAQDVLQQMKMIFQDVRKNPMQAYIKYKAFYDKKANVYNLNEPITSLYYSQKQITKEAKFLLPIFGGLDHILLKRCYRTITIWYAKLAPIRRKFFIE